MELRHKIKDMIPTTFSRNTVWQLSQSQMNHFNLLSTSLQKSFEACLHCNRSFHLMRRHPFASQSTLIGKRNRAMDLGHGRRPLFLSGGNAQTIFRCNSNHSFKRTLSSNKPNNGNNASATIHGRGPLFLSGGNAQTIFLFRHNSNLSFKRSLSSNKPNNSNNANANAKIDSIETLQQQLTTLQADIQKLTYIIHQSQASTTETQSLARRAEARSYIIEQKLINIQSHVVKIPTSLKAIENLAQKIGERVETKLKGYLPQQFQNTWQDSKKLLTNKYTLWSVVAAGVLFYQYRTRMYQRTSEEVANVAAMTLQQDSLRRTIQETLTTVANSPETLESLSLLFQRLIREEKTEQHLIDLIVRALNSEGVRLAAIRLLDLSFQNEELQKRGGEFLKIAATNAVLDEGVQKSAGVGIQRALKNVVTLNVPWGWKQSKNEAVDGVNDDQENDDSNNLNRDDDVDEKVA